MANLTNVAITFNTHGDNKNTDTIVHVFVKNRSVDTFRSVVGADYISNLLSFQAHELNGPFEINPYLAMGQNLAPNLEFEDPSTSTFNLALRYTPIPLEEIVLPLVDVTILVNDEDTWIFDYTVRFTFDDGRSFESSSNRDGVTGIILNENNRNHWGICAENPFIAQPPRFPPQSDAVLQQVCLEFHTHDDNKNDDTKLNVHIVNRLGPSASQDIVVANDILSGQEFEEGSTKRVLFGPGGLPLASTGIRLQDIVLPVVFINIGQDDEDRWIFDYQVTYTFSNGQSFASRTNGVILKETYHKHCGPYQGSAFPNTMAVAGKPPQLIADHRVMNKSISLDFLQQKFDEFINNRQGWRGQDPPIQRLRLHNTGVFNDDSTLPESYYDLQSIVSYPPPPGVLSAPGYNLPVRYNSSPTSIGQQTGWNGIGALYFNDIRSSKISFTVDPTRDLPLSVRIDFDCTNPIETVGGFGQMNFLSFFVEVKMSLAFDPEKARIDLFSWIPKSDTDDDPANGFVNVEVVTENASDPGGFFQVNGRGAIFDQLTKPDPFDNKTLRDRINETANSWFLGGVLAGSRLMPCTNFADGDGCTVQAAGIEGNAFNVSYTRSGRWFYPTPPSNWPTTGRPNPVWDFSPGTLANIDHIIVLTMENHSFDSILGYLSLPPQQRGMGRTEVDGLKGGEFNELRSGQVCRSFPFVPFDTIMTPDPPHSPEPVHRAINGGKMDGFARSYADERGDAVAPRIMGFYTGENVPAYDALARDFAIGHRWFASHPGPTFCNRFYELTGMLNIDPQGFWEFENSSPIRPVFTPTIFDYLSQQEISWTYFEHHYCFLRFFQKYTFDSKHVRAFDDPVFGFFNLARNGALPSVTFIDPHFIELPPGATADGPPADVRKGQEFVRSVVEAVIASPTWNKTLLIITYDEHGGFYDHVPPPAATPVSPEGNLPSTYGVRVPTIVISPWVKPGMVFGHDGILNTTTTGTSNSAAADTLSSVVPRPLYFDHTSILKTIARRFLGESPPYMGARYAEANDLSSVLGSIQHNPAFRPFIPYHFVYAASQKALEVQDEPSEVGAMLFQADQQDIVGQRFSFEDAGNGFFYIRTHIGNLYLTADDSLVIYQDVKYPAHGSTSARKPDRQLWRLTSESVVITERNLFSIQNAHFHKKLLQPAGGSQNSGIPVVLGDPQIVHNPLQVRNAWKVTSPLLGDGGIVIHP